MFVRVLDSSLYTMKS